MLIGRARLQNAAPCLTNSSFRRRLTQRRCNLAEPGVALRNGSAMLDVRLGRTAPAAKFVKGWAGFWSLALPITHHFASNLFLNKSSAVCVTICLNVARSVGKKRFST